jgi:hypothetical protein
MKSRSEANDRLKRVAVMAIAHFISGWLISLKLSFLILFFGDLQIFKYFLKLELYMWKIFWFPGVQIAPKYANNIWQYLAIQIFTSACWAGVIVFIFDYLNRINKSKV